MERHLKQCLDSIVNQTYRSLEIICVNDGSTDGSLAMLEEYANKDSRIVLLNQKNLGPLLARNNGIKHMKGEYLFFIDADDYLEHDAIKTLHDQMVKDGTQIALANFILGDKPNYKFQDTLINVDDVLADVSNCKSRMFPCWGMLIGQCFVDNEFKGYRLCEDELFALDLFVDTDKVSFNPKPLITYRDPSAKNVHIGNFDRYYQGYLAAKEFYKMVGEFRPNLHTYAKCRMLMHTFYSYFCGIMSKDSNKEKLAEMKITIKENRKAVITNSKAVMTVRLISILSYFGLWLPSSLFRVYIKLRG